MNSNRTQPQAPSIVRFAVLLGAFVLTSAFCGQVFSNTGSNYMTRSQQYFRIISTHQTKPNIVLRVTPEGGNAVLRYKAENSWYPTDPAIYGTIEAPQAGVATEVTIPTREGQRVVNLTWESGSCRGASISWRDE